MSEHILFGSRQIDFDIVYSYRKSLGITITPEMEVIVKAPLDAPLDKIKEKVKKRAGWIIKQQNFFLSFYPKTAERKYVGGETHLYLGRQYRLEVNIGEREQVKHKGRFIEVVASEKKAVKTLLLKWYRDKAKLKFAELAAPIIERFKKYHVEPIGLFIHDMPTRWGSCTPKGKIMLNPELIKAPKQCIEYVIVHELCHLVHYDHTQKFIDLQTKEMPDWEKWKKKLEQLLA
jgi:predicted metal-dependent hydrolase